MGVSARYRKDEQALGQSTRRSARSPRSALEIVTTVINSAVLLSCLPKTCRPKY